MPTRPLRVELTVFDRKVAVDGHVPAGDARPDELLPYLYAADNAVIAAAIAKVLALDYDERNRAELERTGDAEPMLRRWFAALA